MRDWLRKTKELQEASFGYSFDDMTLGQKIAYIKEMAYALEDEVHEATDEVGWKSWAVNAFINREEYVKELIDAKHFLGNLFVVVGVTDEELEERYSGKRRVNQERQEREGGYVSAKGVTKCLGCSRSFDDVGRSVESDGWCAKCEPAKETEQ